MPNLACSGLTSHQVPTCSMFIFRPWLVAAGMFTALGYHSGLIILLFSLLKPCLPHFLLTRVVRASPQYKNRPRPPFSQEATSSHIIYWNPNSSQGPVTSSQTSYLLVVSPQHLVCFCTAKQSSCVLTGCYTSHLHYSKCSYPPMACCPVRSSLQCCFSSGKSNNHLRNLKKCLESLWNSDIFSWIFCKLWLKGSETCLGYVTHCVYIHSLR